MDLAHFDPSIVFSPSYHATCQSQALRQHHNFQTNLMNSCDSLHNFDFTSHRLKSSMTTSRRTGHVSMSQSQHRRIGQPSQNSVLATHLRHLLARSSIGHMRPSILCCDIKNSLVLPWQLSKWINIVTSTTKSTTSSTAISYQASLPLATSTWQAIRIISSLRMIFATLIWISAAPQSLPQHRQQHQPSHPASPTISRFIERLRLWYQQLRSWRQHRQHPQD